MDYCSLDPNLLKRNINIYIYIYLYIYIYIILIPRFVKQTDFTIEEIKNLKNIYLNFSQSGKGIDFEHFEYLLQYLYNIQNHPFKVELFKYFDGTGDNCIEFREFIYGLCKLQRGNFNEKGEICFKVYDIYQQGIFAYNNSIFIGELDIECLRHLLKKNYISRMIQIESCIQKTKELSTENEEGLSWEEFSLNLLPDIANCLSIPLGIYIYIYNYLIDRKEYEKSLINELEFEHCFGIEEVESLWNLFRLALDQELTPTRVKWAEAFQAHSPHLLNEQQFKYVMSSKLKVKDLHLLTKLFEMADTDKNNALDIREIVSAILFHLRGTLQHKFALFFDIFAYTSLPLKNILPKEIIIQLLLNSLYLLKLELKSAKRTADQMNTKLGIIIIYIYIYIIDGCISYEEFMNYCENIPNAFDFLGRITLGPYPIPEEREEIFATYSQGEKSLSNFRKTVNNMSNM